MSRLSRIAVLLTCIGGMTWSGAAVSRTQPTVPRSTEDIEKVIVFTANQDFMSRIYLLRSDGSIITWFHYDPYRFVDLEVVDNRVYAAEAFAPRVLEVDLYTGDLEVVVDDWSLYYFYGVAFDGTYWYVDEWDLNRYEFDGAHAGTAAFDEEVMGSTWDGEYLWTLNHDENLVKCWDVGNWPVVVELSGRSFAPPTPACRGLWFDGEALWTAESIDGVPAKIYRFDFRGGIIDQWQAPAFNGWAACAVEAQPFRLVLDRNTLIWSETLGALAYDVVRGNLGRLQANSGNFSISVDRCLAEDLPSTILAIPDDPPPGAGFWYLVRGVSEAQNLTYDTSSAQQAAPRDAAIDASPRSCL